MGLRPAERNLGRAATAERLRGKLVRFERLVTCVDNLTMAGRYLYSVRVESTVCDLQRRSTGDDFEAVSTFLL